MKLSELVEKYGDIDLNDEISEKIIYEMEKIDCTEKVVNLIKKTNLVLVPIVNKLGSFVVSSFFNATIIKCTNGETYIVDLQNGDLQEIKSNYDLFFQVLYFVSCGEYGDWIGTEKELIEMLNESQDFSILNRLDGWLDEQKKNLKKPTNSTLNT